MLSLASLRELRASAFLMDAEEALTVAETFLAEYHPAFSSVELSHTFWLSDDAVMFSWSEFAPSGVRLMREVSLTVNCATGALSSYSARHDSAKDITADFR